MRNKREQRGREGELGVGGGETKLDALHARLKSTLVFFFLSYIYSFLFSPPFFLQFSLPPIIYYTAPFQLYSNGFLSKQMPEIIRISYYQDP